MNRVAYSPSSPHLSVFKASFARKCIRTSVMADQGAGANFVSVNLLNKSQQNTGKIRHKSTKPAAHISRRNRRSMSSLYQQRQVRIILTNSWLDAFSVEENLVEGHQGGNINACYILKCVEALRFDNREMLLAARDKYGDEFDDTSTWKKMVMKRRRKAKLQHYSENLCSIAADR